MVLEVAGGCWASDCLSMGWLTDSSSISSSTSIEGHFILDFDIANFLAPFELPRRRYVVIEGKFLGDSWRWRQDRGMRRRELRPEIGMRQLRDDAHLD
jgi:hypothetical protein